MKISLQFKIIILTKIKMISVMCDVVDVLCAIVYRKCRQTVTIGTY